MRGLLAPLIKLIIFLVVTSFATYVLAATIANTSYGSTTGYKADVTDASGLQVGDDVRIAGVRVGTVTGIGIVKVLNPNPPADPKKRTYHRDAQVSFNVSKDRPLPKSAEVYLRYRNLIGQRYVDVEQGQPGNSNAMLTSKDVISESHTHPAVDLTVLFAGFKNLFQGLDATQINELSEEIIQVLQGEGGSLDLLFSNLADLTNSLADKSQVIDDVIDNLTSALKAIGDNDSDLADLIDQLDGFVHGLATDRQTIGASIDGINSLTTSTAGLLTQLRPPLAKGISDLSALTASLDQNKPTLQYVVQHLPTTIGPLIRTASYGSWFNFYLCSVSGTLTLPGKLKVHIPVTHSSQPRCQG
jgi:phospholipid/cholesterol/gamma-HCH transport system substrate-binding protein